MKTASLVAGVNDSTTGEAGDGMVVAVAAGGGEKVAVGSVAGVIVSPQAASNNHRTAIKYFSGMSEG
jgi:hypothetical protein